MNVGYTAVGGEIGGGGLLGELGANESLPDEFNYAAGLEFAAHPKLTLIGDVVGRTLRDAGRLGLVSKSFDYQGATSVQTVQFDEFEQRGGNLNLTLGTVGFKFNPVGDLLISGNVLFPLSDAGLRSRLTTVIEWITRSEFVSRQGDDEGTKGF